MRVFVPILSTSSSVCGASALCVLFPYTACFSWVLPSLKDVLVLRHMPLTSLLLVLPPEHLPSSFYPWQRFTHISSKTLNSVQTTLAAGICHAVTYSPARHSSPLMLCFQCLSCGLVSWAHALESMEMSRRLHVTSGFCPDQSLSIRLI